MGQTKKLIFTADDFGYDEAFNVAILKAFKDGMLNSAALLSNFSGFEQAVEFYSDMNGCQLGVHLNIIEGNSLTTGEPFADGFISILKKSYDKSYMNFVEKEFRAQIEKVLSRYPAQHINSHVHVHGIPKIFELACKLAEEYKIDYIRTQFERPYFVPDLGKYIGLAYPINMVKVALLDTFTVINKQTLKKYNLLTNNYLIGVNYTANMDVNTIKCGLNAIKNKAKVAEILVHPCFYDDEQMKKTQHYKEYSVFVDENLKNEINNQGWVIEK